jgi:hypothetical protein
MQMDEGGAEVAVVAPRIQIRRKASRCFVIVVLAIPEYIIVVLH